MCTTTHLEANISMMTVKLEVKLIALLNAAKLNHSGFIIIELDHVIICFADVCNKSI
jgi:hypothetical protein